MERTCGNCGETMERLSDKQYYCKKCNETFVVTEGKQTVAPQKNVIDQMKDIIKDQNTRIVKLEEGQKKDDSLDGFLFPGEE